MNSTAIILLAGGQGSRFGGSIPKQFVSLGDQLLIHYSLQVLIQLPSLVEIVVVCAPEYRHFFGPDTIFAQPGERRQDSVLNGLNMLKSEADFICIHDGARPFITSEILNRVVDAAHTYGAATAGMPLKYTVKERDKNHFVLNTPDRSMLWEIQTPQVINRNWLEEGFSALNGENVTDDVSVVEKIGYPVKLVEGAYRNIKITSPEDLTLAHQYLGLVHVV